LRVGLVGFIAIGGNPGALRRTLRKSSFAAAALRPSFRPSFASFAPLRTSFASNAEAAAASLTATAVQVLRRAFGGTDEENRAAAWVLAVNLVAFAATEAVLVNVHFAKLVALKDELEATSVNGHADVVDDFSSCR
jgi:hypothetical protein